MLIELTRKSKTTTLFLIVVLGLLLRLRGLETVGRSIRFDPEAEQVIGDEEANLLLRDGDRGYRAPFMVPEAV